MRKEFNASDLQILNPLEFIKSHPEMFFPNGIVSGAVLASGLVFDILISSETVVSSKRHRDWWTVSAQTDWISRTDRFVPENPLDVFKQMVPFPLAGDNTIHQEVLIAAFATDVVTFTTDVPDLIKGTLSDDVLAYLSAVRPRFGRLVAFRM